MDDAPGSGCWVCGQGFRDDAPGSGSRVGDEGFRVLMANGWGTVRGGEAGVGTPSRVLCLSKVRDSFDLEPEIPKLREA